MALCVFALEKSLAGDHDCDSKGDAPETDFTLTGRFRYEGDVILMGVETEINVSMTPGDKDIHQATATDTPTPADDTFSNPGAVEWSEDLGGWFDDSTKTSTKYFAPEIENEGHMFIKIKDDGVHAQDFDQLTEVCRIDVKIVKPDGVNIISQDQSFVAYQSPTITVWPQMTTPVVWQATYGGEALACRVWLVEKYQFSEFKNQVLSGDYEFNRNGDWLVPDPDDWSSFNDRTNADGQYTDVHNSLCRYFANANQYIDWGGAQYIGLKGTSTTVPLGTFDDHEYAIGASTPDAMQGIHDEVPES